LLAISCGFHLQETAQLEADTFVQRQKVALASEVKSVLDSWVRFEQQAKENEQAELAKSIIAKVLSSVRDEKTQRDILNGAVAEVERKCRSSRILWKGVLNVLQNLLRARLSRIVFPSLLLDQLAEVLANNKFHLT
jgi:hypothetical protein